MTRQLCKRRKLSVATDIDSEHLARGFLHRAALRVYKLDAERATDFAPFANRMDTVVCLDVLEHIRGDAGTISGIHAKLWPR